MIYYFILLSLVLNIREDGYLHALLHSLIQYARFTNHLISIHLITEPQWQTNP